MQKNKFLFLFMLTLFFFACRNQETNTKSELPKSPRGNMEKLDTEKKELLISEALYYVAAKSGLNFRKKPKGTVLGKWPLNTPVKVIERTGIIEAIEEEEEVIKGEWVGAALEEDTVYVFDAFLSSEFIILPEEPPAVEEFPSSKYQHFGIYNLDSYQKSQGEDHGFIILTDAFPWSQHPDSLSIADRYLGHEEINDYHFLNKEYRARFLKRRQVAETDKVFIYFYALDTIFTFPVHELQLLARINPYGAEPPIVHFDYMIGFDLAGKLKLKDAHLHYFHSLVYVGAQNPFIQGKLQPITWEEIADSHFPSLASSTEIYKRYPKNKLIASYKFSTDDYHYFLRRYSRTNHLVATSKNKEIIFNKTFQESEGVSFAPLNYTNVENEYNPEQWTGKLFKNMPPVIFGFLYESFSCTNIDLLGEQEHPIYIRCDCRH